MSFIILSYFLEATLKERRMTRGYAGKKKTWSGWLKKTDTTNFLNANSCSLIEWLELLWEWNVIFYRNKKLYLR